MWNTCPFICIHEESKIHDNSVFIHTSEAKGAACLFLVVTKYLICGSSLTSARMSTPVILAPRICKVLKNWMLFSLLFQWLRLAPPCGWNLYYRPVTADVCSMVEMGVKYWPKGWYSTSTWKVLLEYMAAIFISYFFRVCYLEKCLYHFLNSTSGPCGAKSTVVTMLFSSLLAPDLPSYNYGLGLLQVSYNYPLF